MIERGSIVEIKESKLVSMVGKVGVVIQITHDYYITRIMEYNSTCLWHIDYILLRWQVREV